MTQENNLLGKFKSITISNENGTFVSGQSVNAPNAPCLHGRSAQAILCL